MRRPCLLWLSLVGVLTFGAIATTSSALALEGVWLVNGAKPTAGVAVLGEGLEGSLGELFENTKKGVAILCLMSFQGFVGLHLEENETDVVGAIWGEITQITNPSKTSNTITCSFEENKHGPCEASSNPTVKAENLPWLTEMQLVGGVVRDVIRNGLAAEVGWDITCRVFGVSFLESCSAHANWAEIDNNAGGYVEALFNAPPNGVLADCTGPFEKELEVGLMEGDILVRTESGLPLAGS